MRRFTLTAIFIVSTFIAFAQKGTVTGILVDSVDTKKTLNYATISVFKGTDTILNTYRLSDDKGVFKINNLDLGIKYRLVINAWMYNIVRKEITIEAGQPNINLGTIALSEKTNMLNEVVIQSERPPVIVRKDTIEFNAESFKTLPSAVVEDMLKKLPGVSVDNDGNITVNGKSVSKILVDGKEFFGGDQQIATKNLPANIIDKIQVTDDKDAKRRDPDILAANTPQVINLKLKKAIKSGAFGKLYAGGGIKDLYEAGGIMNFFRDTTQVSVLAYGNNANKPGFNMGDVMRIGGFQRAGVNSMMVNSEGAFSLNGISFGGSMSGGVQKSAGAGANFNTLTKKGTKINTKYFFGQANNLTERITDIDQTYNNNNRLFTNSVNNQDNNNYTHNFGGRIEAKLDSLTQLTIEPSISLGKTRNYGSTITSNRDSNNEKINDGDKSSNVKGLSTEYNLSTNLWKDFKKAGRSLNISLNVSKKENDNDNFNLNNTYFFNPISSKTIDQLRSTNIRNFNTYLSLNYSEPLNKKLTLGIVTNGNYIDNENALSTFYKNPANQVYDIAVPNLTETVMQSGFKTNTRVTLKWKVNQSFNIQPGIVFNTINLENKFLKNPQINQDYTFFAPQLTVRYKDLNLSYTPSFREADVSYLQPVQNNTDDLFTQNGNPYLLPSKTHQINLNVYKYDTKRTLSYNAYLGGSIQNDGIIMSKNIYKDGRQESTPVNANGIWQFHANGNLSKDFKNNPKFQYNLNTGFWSNFNRGIVLVNNERSHSNILQFGPRIGGRINLNDKIELGETYSVTFNNSKYETNQYQNISSTTQNSDSELIIRFPKKVVWETNYRIQYDSQKINGYSNTQQLWNAAVTLLFMKNDRLQLKASVNDILNTNLRNNVYINANAINMVKTNNLGRHGLLTLTYNIQNFGGKVGGRETMFRF